MSVRTPYNMADEIDTKSTYVVDVYELTKSNAKKIQEIGFKPDHVAVETRILGKSTSTMTWRHMTKLECAHLMKTLDAMDFKGTVRVIDASGYQMGANKNFAAEFRALFPDVYTYIASLDIHIDDDRSPFVYTSMVDAPQHKVCLLIIDPQNDFVGDDAFSGTLEVPNAKTDMQRIADMVRTRGKDIDEIVVTMDAHMVYHISHPIFWVDARGEHPKPFTQITLEAYDAGTWRTTRVEDAEFAREYLDRLEKQNRFKHTIWPEHCLIGSFGQSVNATLYAALKEWEEAMPGRTVKYVQKGNDAHTEMYSALRAEVPISAKTDFNQALADHLMRFDRIVVTGEAASHCVNYTVRDLIEHESNAADKLYVIKSMMSEVTGFVGDKESFFRDVVSSGGHVVETEVEAF